MHKKVLDSRCSVDKMSKCTALYLYYLKINFSTSSVNSFERGKKEKQKKRTHLIKEKQKLEDR